MHDFKKGDLVGIRHPSEKDSAIKTGIVMETSQYNIIVQWTSYNKDFFMEKQGDIFEELNKSYLLTRQSYHRLNDKAALYLLNPS